MKKYRQERNRRKVKNEIVIEVYYVALVKKPRIEISIHGEHIDELPAHESRR